MSDLNERREAFRAELAELLGRIDAKATPALTPGIVVVCVPAACFNPASNALWENPENHSSVRPNMLCDDCGGALAVSNWMYRRLLHMTQRPQIFCTDCMAVSLEKRGGQ